MNILDPNGKPLLTRAISKCTGRDTKFFINAGADVNVVDVNNNTALIIIARRTECGSWSRMRKVPVQS